MYDLCILFLSKQPFIQIGTACRLEPFLSDPVLALTHYLSILIAKAGGNGLGRETGKGKAAIEAIIRGEVGSLFFKQ